MSDIEQGAILRALIEEGDVEVLDKFLEEQAVIDLSNFPDGVGTPLAHAVVHQRKNIFTYLIRRNVDLHAAISVQIPNPHTGAGVGLVKNLNILGFCVMQQPNDINYYEYAEILCEEGVEICSPDMDLTSQPVWLLFEKIHSLLRDPVTIMRYFNGMVGGGDRWNRDHRDAVDLLELMVEKEIRRGRPAGAEMLTEIFCNQPHFRSIFLRPFLLSEIILQLMEAGEDINLEIYDFSRFPLDDTTRRIYNWLKRKQNEQSLVFRRMEDPYNRHYHQSPISMLPVELRTKILNESVSENLRRLERDECAVCFNVRNLHQVCTNGHKLCGTCRVEMIGRGQFNCPICRTRMIDTWNLF